jgi:predicted nucleic acid-binding protein
VLDSNVWIDILVFDDPVTRPILAALENASLRSVTDARCLHELQRVLDYPQFARFAIDKASAMATVLRLSTVQPAADATEADVKTAADAAAQAAIAARDHASAATAGPSRATAGLAPAHAPAGTAPRTGPSLPLCSDRDDQKFLELAAASQADWLVTKDKALLKLSRRMTRDFSCRVDRPAGFVAAALALP